MPSPRRGAPESGADPADDPALEAAGGLADRPSSPRRSVADDEPVAPDSHVGRRLGEVREQAENLPTLQPPAPTVRIVPVVSATLLTEDDLPQRRPKPRPAAGSTAGPGVSVARRAADESAEPAGRRGVGEWLWHTLASARPRHSTVRGDIEGLRAIAVIWVLLFHLGLSQFGGGFAGVDVFFVISGFLITGQLMSSARRGGRLDLVAFYARRAKRLLPAATLVLITTVLLGWAWLPRSEWELLAKDSAAAAVYSLNWFLAGRSVDYLAEDAHPTAVQHFWSLAVEEQFYIVWPLLIIAGLALARRRGWRPLRTVVWILVGIVVLSFAWSVVHTRLDAGPAYFVSTTRAWELGLGALVAAALPHLQRWPRWAGTVLAPIGLLMVLATAFVVTPQTAWPGYAALLPTVGAALVVLAGSINDSNPTARLLGFGPLPWIGMLSYSMYLWHWPLIVFWKSRDAHLAWWEMVLIGLITIVLSALTLRFVEDPVRFNGWLSRRRKLVLVAAAVAMACSLTASYVVWRQAPQLTTVDVLDPGGPDPTPASSGPSGSQTPSPSPSSSSPSSSPSTSPTPTVPATPMPVVGDYTGALSLVYNSSVTGVPTLRPDLGPALAVTKPMLPDPAVAGQDLPPVYANGCHREKNETTVVAAGQCLIGDPNGSVTVALVGDSKMDQWQPALDVIGKRHGWRIQGLGKSGCSFSSAPQYTQCNTYNHAVLQRLLGEVPDIVITSTYDQDFNAGPGMVSFLRQLETAGAQIVLINDNPTPPGTESVYQCVTRTKSNAQCEFPRNPGHGSTALTMVHNQMPESVLVDLNDWVCPPTLAKCPVSLGNVFLYRQSSHLTNTYVRSMTPVLERMLVEQGLLAGQVLPLQPR